MSLWPSSERSQSDFKIWWLWKWHICTAQVSHDILFINEVHYKHCQVRVQRIKHLHQSYMYTTLLLVDQLSHHAIMQKYGTLQEKSNPFLISMLWSKNTERIYIRTCLIGFELDMLHSCWHSFVYYLSCMSSMKSCYRLNMYISSSSHPHPHPTPIPTSLPSPPNACFLLHSNSIPSCHLSSFHFTSSPPPIPSFVISSLHLSLPPPPHPTQHFYLPHSPCFCHAVPLLLMLFAIPLLPHPDPIPHATPARRGPDCPPY